MRNSIIIVGLMIVLNTSRLAADIATPTDYYDGGVSSTLEGIVSLEKSLSMRTSLMLWLGGGIAGALSPEVYENYSAGIEGALELRYYPMSEVREDIFISVYHGIGYMHGPRTFYKWNDMDEYRNYTIQGFGCKVGYKWIAVGSTENRSAFRLAFEPYWSVGLTYYYDRLGADIADYFVWNSPWLNIGLRIVFEYVLP